ncbi:hypothetical protein D5F52_17550 [Brevibacillus laterosporus]|nr:hypothetical protein BrL25_12840 [Brevibacillus laterosporus DSM 25]AYB39921.1 hypothetical protein D5F52_17550 [Brevibacillus laterosporus]MBG9802785.1 hypothetical protein [Brevibacillus laterosporus]MBM7110568.1 hypothetical protein [Brevibacillus laterosporus]TPH18369.1 hypothetical protein EGH09_08475 [Brevibacillus laterosporus]
MVRASCKIYIYVVFVGTFIIKDINVSFNKRKQKDPIISFHLHHFMKRKSTQIGASKKEQLYRSRPNYHIFYPSWII